MFDADAMMRNFAGHRSIAIVMLESLMTDLPERLDALSSALAGGDPATAQREAHTIKGLGGNGGAGLLRDLALQIENQCRAGSLDEARRGMPALDKEVRAVLAEWRVFLAAPA